ncbi:hypothetical protein FOCC_FOCC009629, partial [Frankliniella occidentalis]
MHRLQLAFAQLLRQAVAPLNDPEVLAQVPARNSRGTRFLLFDSGPGNPDRVVVFADEESLKVPFVSEIVFSDGTFKTVPNQFGWTTDNCTRSMAWSRTWRR